MFFNQLLKMKVRLRVKVCVGGCLTWDVLYQLTSWSVQQQEVEVMKSLPRKRLVKHLCTVVLCCMQRVYIMIVTPAVSFS